MPQSAQIWWRWWSGPSVGPFAGNWPLPSRGDVRPGPIRRCRCHPERVSDRWSGVAGLLLLVGSFLALAVAPLVLPDDYDWFEHTTSEAGAQGVDGAWVARLGFVLLGLAVLAISTRAAPRWGSRATAFHRAFGLGMIAVAAFSARSWADGAAHDPTEDLLHSVAATVVGLSFALGVLAVLLTGREKGQPVRIFDVVAVAAAIVIPLAMTQLDGAEGLLQRLMFLVAYVWYGREALPGAVSDLSTAAVAAPGTR